MLVAISILLLVIIGPMTITTKTAKSTTFATEQVTAFFLAQEGLELAQKGRDDLLLQGFLPVNPLANPWAVFTNQTGTYQSCYNATGCGLAWGAVAGSLAAIENCATIANCRISHDINSANRAYFSYNGGTDTLYTRQIFFTPEPLVNPTSVRVNSVVTWRTGSLVSSQRVEVETYLYDIF